jgi:hypothetical protein
MSMDDLIKCFGFQSFFASSDFLRESVEMSEEGLSPETEKV